MGFADSVSLRRGRRMALAIQCSSLYAVAIDAWQEEPPRFFRETQEGAKVFPRNPPTQRCRPRFGSPRAALGCRANITLSADYRRTATERNAMFEGVTVIFLAQYSDRLPWQK